VDGLSRVLRALGQAVARTAQYLGPLLRDALVYVWRMGADLAHGPQFLWRRWQVRRRPETAGDFAAWRGSFGERRAARWAHWRALTTGRRMAVRAATVGLALVLFVAARAPWTKPTFDASSAAAVDSSSTATTSLAPTSSVPAPENIAQGIERMRSAIARASSGQELFLADGPVVPLGPNERWNGFRVGAPAVVREGDARYQLWYRGCRLHGIDHSCAIGRATSSDGLEWTTTADPVLTPSEGSDEFDLGSIAVVRANETYFMWYSLWPDRFDGRPMSELFLATSADGARWEDHGRVLTSEEPMVALQPSVVHDGRQFHLWFVDSRLDVKGVQPEKEGGPFLRHFTSSDGRTFQEQPEFHLGPLGRGRIRMSVARERDGSYRAFYFGRVAGKDEVSTSVGWLASADGSDWRIVSTRPVATSSLGSGVEYVSDATAMRTGSGSLVWFVTAYPGGRQDIRAAFFKE
jgi:hypothetical protein